MTKLEKIRVVHNPFHPKGATNPKYYANREHVLKYFKENVISASKSKITRPDHILVLGDWGIGKTSTLMKFKDLLHNELYKRKVRAFSSLVSIKPSFCQGNKVFNLAVLQSMMNDYSLSSPSRQKVFDFIKEEARLFNKWELNKLSIKGPEIERKKEDVSLDLVATLTRFWKKLEANNIEIAVIMLDDIQYLLTEGWGKALYDLRTDIQTLSSKGCNYLFVCSGNLDIFPDMYDLAEPFVRLFEKFKLKKLDINGTKEMIEKPLQVERINMKVDNKIIKKIHSLTEGHPYFITTMMHDLIKEVQGSRISTKEFNRIYPTIRSHLADMRFHNDLHRATTSEKEVLFAVSKNKNPEFSPSDIKIKFVNKILERLTGKNLLIKISRGNYKLYHPLFKEFLRETNQK